jgi:predicted transcriptional regulator
MGSLETEVLDVLWDSPDALTPAQVRERLGHDLAYTTVMTILSRLWHKGVLERSRVGRAYAYRPGATEAETRAERMRAELDRTTDRSAVLSRFVDALEPGEADALRRILDDLDDA